MNADPGFPPVDEQTVRRFVELIHDAAKVACHGIGRPGLLQLYRISSTNERDQRPYRFPIGAVDAMTDQAVADAKAGYNLYVEGRTVDEDTPRGKRGDQSCTRAVFALVADDDGDKGMATVDKLEPSLVIQTSPGNSHRWYFLARALPHAEAAKIGMGMKAAMGGDSDTGTPTQPYRVAGTPNFPNAAKQARGRRNIEPTSILEHGGRAYEPDELNRTFPFVDEPRASASAGAEAYEGPSRDIAKLLKACSPTRIRQIGETSEQMTARGTDRSRAFMMVVGFVRGDGFSMAEAVTLLRAFPNSGFMEKYGNRIEAETARVWNKVEDRPDTGDGDGAPQFDGDPVDLWGHFAPPSLPRGLLPDLVERYAVTLAETMGVDPGGVAMAALAVCAAAIPDGIKLRMKHHTEDWTESARLWVGLLGDPSAKKSPIISATARPLLALDFELHRKYQLDLQEYEQLEKDERKAAQKPVQTRLRLEDTTIEGAQEVLAGSPNGLLMVQDELSGFFGSMDKYSGHRGAAKDRGFWLQAYNGGPYALNRVGRGSAIIPNLSISLLGGIQPDVLRRLAAESHDDGFLQRMLFVVLPDAMIGKDVPTPPVTKDYDRLVEQLTKMRPTRRNLDGVLIFDRSAQEMRLKLEERHLKLAKQAQTLNRKLAAHIGKYDGLFGRLCVAFHCIEHAGDSDLPAVVTEDTATRAARLMREFLLPHGLAVYGNTLKLADDHDRLAAVAGHILAHRKERMTNRDVQRGDRTMRRLSWRETEEIFQQLDALGWLVRTPGPRKSDLPHWAVNPVVHQKFAERAKAEAGTRKAGWDLFR